MWIITGSPYIEVYDDLLWVFLWTVTIHEHPWWASMRAPRDSHYTWTSMVRFYESSQTQSHTWTSMVRFYESSQGQSHTWTSIVRLYGSSQEQSPYMNIHDELLWELPGTVIIHEHPWWDYMGAPRDSHHTWTSMMKFYGSSQGQLPYMNMYTPDTLPKRWWWTHMWSLLPYVNTFLTSHHF